MCSSSQADSGVRRDGVRFAAQHAFFGVGWSCGSPDLESLAARGRPAVARYFRYRASIQPLMLQLAKFVHQLLGGYRSV
jgi:hypothetical protein